MDVTAVTASDDGCHENNTFYLEIEIFAEAFLHNSVDRVMISKVLPLIFAIGLAGNVAFLFSLLRVKWMRTVTNYYLANLAIADVSFLVVVVGEKIIAYRMTEIAAHMVFGQAGCLIANTLRRLVFFSSLFLVTLVSLERYYAICKPVQHWALNGKGQTLKLVAGCWALASVFALILVPSTSNLQMNRCVVWPDTPRFKDFPVEFGYCSSLYSNIWLPVSEGITIVPFIIALVANTFFYTRILMNLHSRTLSKSGSVGKSAQNVEILHQVARMLIINGSVFFLCLAPYQLMNFTRMIISSTNKSYLLPQDKIKNLVWIFRILVYLNSVINPIVYMATSPRYRHGFIMAFTCGNVQGRKTYIKGTAMSNTKSTATTKQ